jgi:RNA polymerase sigma factor (sigma-70 family)
MDRECRVDLWLLGENVTTLGSISRSEPGQTGFERTLNPRLSVLSNVWTLTWERDLAVDGRERDRVGELYEQCAPEALRLAFLLTGNRTRAEDVFHDAFVRAAGRLGSLRDRSAFRQYLYRTVTKRVISEARRGKIERRFLLREVAQLPHSTSDENQTFGDKDNLKSALYRLPARQRAALVFRFYADLSIEETAQCMGCSVGAVKSLTSRGLEELRYEVKRVE